MAIDVLKLLDEGIRPLLDVHGHGARQRPLLSLLHHRLQWASLGHGSDAKEVASGKATSVQHVA
jgi:hypothetical protein